MVRLSADGTSSATARLHGGSETDPAADAEDGIEAVYRRPRTTVPHPEHKKWPHLLRGLDIIRPNHVWCADITYIPMRRGFLYFVAVMDWVSRRVLAWRLSSTMDVDFCTVTLEEALARHGKPEIFNTDQGARSPVLGSRRS